MGQVTNYLELLTIWHWVGLGVSLIILDVLLGASFFLLWLGVAAIVVAAIMFVLPELSWQYQLLIYSLEAIACIFFWNGYLKHNPTQSDKPRLNRRSEQYIGRVFTLEEPIVNGRGKINVDDSTWRIEGEDLKAGTRVKVTGVNGVILHVQAVDKEI